MFENIKAGDRVVLQSGYMRKDIYTVEKVKRVTKTLVIIEDERGLNRKFKKATGMQYPRSGGWSSNDYIHCIDDKIMKKVETTELHDIADRLRRFDFHSLVDDSPDILKQVYSLVEKYEETKDGS